MSPWRQRVAPLSICHNSVNGNVNVTVSQLLVPKKPNLHTNSLNKLLITFCLHFPKPR
jgi:hypothetical protein